MYYTKRFDLPGRFTAMNGAIQYFEVEADEGVVFDYVAADETDAELVKQAVSQANYLRVLEVLRSRGAQPIITSVKGAKVSFTLEQTWVYGDRDKMQVSERYTDYEGRDEAKRLSGLTADAIADIEAAFANVVALKAKDASCKIEELELVDDTKKLCKTDGVKVVLTAGSLNANGEATE